MELTNLKNLIEDFPEISQKYQLRTLLSEVTGIDQSIEPKLQNSVDFSTQFKMIELKLEEKFFAQKLIYQEIKQDLSFLKDKLDLMRYEDYIDDEEEEDKIHTIQTDISEIKGKLFTQSWIMLTHLLMK